MAGSRSVWRPSPSALRDGLDRAPRGNRRPAAPIARPRREQRAQQQHRSTQAAHQVLSGSSLSMLAQRIRSVVLPMPSTSAPRSSSRRAITSTSAMRGMLRVRTTDRSAGRRQSAAAPHSCCLRRQRVRRACRLQSLVSTRLSILHSATLQNSPQVNDLISQNHAELIFRRRGGARSGHGCRPRSRAVVDDEVGMRRRHARRCWPRL